MAPYAVPTPHIVPFRTPFSAGQKNIDTDTKVQLFCDTDIEHEVFYTLDGTKPQPYAGIVQGSKLYKYTSPFTLPVGKITVKAIALHARVHSMRSNVITKCFEVVNSKSPRTKSKVKGKRTKYKGIEDSDNSLMELKVNNCLLPNKQSDCAQDMEAGLEKNKEAAIDSTPNCTNLEKDYLDDIPSDESKSNSINSLNENVVDYNNFITSNENLPETDDEISCGSFDDDGAVKAEVLQLNDEENIILQDPGYSSIQQNSSNIYQPCCVKCKMCVQSCLSCSQVNAYESKYCIQCGEKLSRICYICHQPNTSIATFCQYCGNKLDSNSSKDFSENESIVAQSDQSILVKPDQRDIGIQRVPVWMNKCTQTSQMQNEKKNDAKDLKAALKKIPPHSPGRGYWHQQLDFICNHLKSHAYNNIEFRQLISEPSLSDFQSAHVAKDENQVVVSIIFSPYVKNI